MLSITKNYEILSKRTHTKPQETFKFKLTKASETFSLQPSINLGLDSEWMVGLTSLEVDKSIFNKTEENNKVELFTNPSDDKFSYAQLKDDVAEILGLSDTSSQDLQHKIHGPDII